MVIPTHNRAGLLLKVLGALAEQTFSPHEFEVVVVADGCSDRTAQEVRSFNAPYRLSLIELPGSGPAVARNSGADHSRGRLLIFIDDDIEVQPGFIQAHVDAHQGEQGRVVIGYLPLRIAAQAGYFQVELIGWWDKMFQRMGAAGHRFAHSDLLSGNFSIEASFFEDTGKFDPSFRVHEDYELGMRLVKAGARFHFSPEAWGWHHENTDLARSLQRKVDEGLADVDLCRLYPELAPNTLMFALYKYALWPSRIMTQLAFWAPAVGDRLAGWMARSLDTLERWRLYGLWQRGLYGLMGYWYWRGVKRKLGTWRAFKQMLNTALRIKALQNTVLYADLAQGLERIEQLLDALRPECVKVGYGKTPVGMLRPIAGCERLHASHLRPALANDLFIPLIKAYALNGALDLPDPLEGLVAWCDQEMLRNGNAPGFDPTPQRDQVSLEYI